MLSSSRCHLLIRNLVAVTAPHSLASISTGSVWYQADYYNALGVPKSSTQGEIKAAYYKLSMMYHPDKNQGSEAAAVKFREITRAYEVLGNFKLRRLYDKGIIQTAGSKYSDGHQETTIYDTEVQPEDDPSTKFYKSRFSKSKVVDTEGRTPIYNFDEWSRQHYGATFERRQTAKAKYNRQENQKVEQKFAAQNEILLVGIFILFSVVYCSFMTDSSYDTPKGRAIRSAEEEKRREKETTT